MERTELELADHGDQITQGEESNMDVGTLAGPWLSRHPLLMRGALKGYARRRGCSIAFSDDAVTVSRNGRQVRLSSAHSPYARDVIDEFDYYFDAIEGDGTSVDFRSAAEHRLRGWEHFPVLTPALPEHVDTCRQYIELTDPGSGATVLDLGAYSGVSAMVFQEAVGPSGQVCAVEADPFSAHCSAANFTRYESMRGYAPALVRAAVWSTDGEVEFAAEGSLGSAVRETLARDGGRSMFVPAMTLTTLVNEANLDTVDVIKADIEGAEFQAFSDGEFFKQHRPVLVFEPAQTRVADTRLDRIAPLLAGYGYRLKVVAQRGSRLPLVVCR